MPPQYDNYQQPPQPQQPQPYRDVREAPVDVQTARHLWWLVAALGLIPALVGLTLLVGKQDFFLDSMLTQIKNDPSLSDVNPDEIARAVEVAWIPILVIAAVIMAAITGVFLLFVRSMVRGRSWARVLLTMGGVFVAVMTLPLVFGFGDDALFGSATTLAFGGLQILQAVAAVGAIALMYRKESNEFFRPQTPELPQPPTQRW